MNEHIFSLTGATNKGAFQPRPRITVVREFVRRQFQPETTRSQLIFDITVGMLAPLLCLVFDPLVFRSGVGGAPLAGRFQLFTYSVIAVEIIALAVWLWLGERAGEWCGVLGGSMLAGALFSTLIGICLLPFSIIGLIFIIGIFGFIPFLTGFIYLRNARRALKAADARMVRAALFSTLMWGATLALGLPVFVNWRVGRMIEQSMAEVLSGGDEAQVQAAARRLRPVSWVVASEIDRVAWAYAREPDPSRKERLARAYREITGGDVESRLAVFRD